MRRGLLAWDPSEVPEDVLNDRVARCQAAMSDANIEALLVYTNFPRPAAVSWLTHFVPYWSQGVLLVPAAGSPEFFVSLSKRVAGWIAETSHMGDIVSTPRLGADLGERLKPATRIGVVELDRLPGGIAGPLCAAHPKIALTDGTDLFRAIRNPADEAEIAQSRRAAALAFRALHEMGDGAANTLISRIEAAARLEGAEEVLIEVAPDLEADATLRRAEGEIELADRYAIRLSLAYKGHWVRYGRTLGCDPSERDAVGSWLAEALPSLNDGSGSLPVGNGIAVRAATIEACTGSLPLSKQSAPPPGAVATVNLQLEKDGEIWLESRPLLFSREADLPAAHLTEI
jgi:hypothetical protein